MEEGNVKKEKHQSGGGGVCVQKGQELLGSKPTAIWG